MPRFDEPNIDIYDLIDNAIDEELGFDEDEERADLDEIRDDLYCCRECEGYSEFDDLELDEDPDDDFPLSMEYPDENYFDSDLGNEY
jgi:hypothetical protein